MCLFLSLGRLYNTLLVEFNIDSSRMASWSYPCSLAYLGSPVVFEHELIFDTNFLFFSSCVHFCLLRRIWQIFWKKTLIPFLCIYLCFDLIKTKFQKDLLSTNIDKVKELEEHIVAVVEVDFAIDMDDYNQ